ncbi:MAG: prephenate dehydratase [Chloroflexi bacterium]|nr:prephenate dehydratase [Chloroflexota bacterium]MCY3583833.1 prephenate dehydratase [Chloroflexota bacterium]MCY3716235.1 prephenate dehydratase [Chloroflexota bacterium]MDE2650436.1 prephenate dehydratase [Chloroflexota bacterium]MXV93205.1 prephenate dehydratase [Chloroflexota bacterium]
MPKVAYQGIPGANSEIAVHQHFGDAAQPVPCQDLNHLFNALQNGTVEYSLLPVENALAGSVAGAYEMLLDHDVRIQAEVILHVRHNLLASPGATMQDIQQVRSHPQALMQCKRFLERNNFEPFGWYDTAGAAQDLAKSPEPGVAAIASRLAGELYKLDVLAQEIEDAPFNYTRFLLLGHGDPPPGEYNKTSIIFATRNRPAALYECLGEFAQRDLNLTKIESRPRRNRPWEPLFYLDFEGHWQEQRCQELLMQLLQLTSFLKLLGSYPAVRSGTVGM